MPKQNTDFLRFSAYSIKDLIMRKLTEDTAFSDQNFPASNLNILIDLVSYMYQVLLYNLNNAAAESMFSDTQLYENMNRLCKFIGYNPMGAVPGHCTFSFPLNDNNKYKNIPKYSAIATPFTGTDGRSTFFSVGNIPVKVEDPDWKTQTITLYNGVWKLSPRTYLYEGNDWEEITLDGIVSDASQDRFTGHQMVDIYAVNFNDDKTISDIQLFRPAPMGLFKSPTTGNFLNSQDTQNGPIELRRRIFTNDVPGNDSSGNLLKTLQHSNQPNDCVFDLRLNEEKTYTARFGDNVTGRKPKVGSVLYVMYFEVGANIRDDVAIGSVTDATFINSPGFFGMSGELYNHIIGTDSSYALELDGEPLYLLQNVTVPTSRQAEEDVDSIRDNAPNWFKLAGRLVTQADYEYYISTSPDFPGITKCKCQNNWEYVSTFYKWLYETGLKKHGDGSYYLNQNNMSKMGWKVADAADGNNVYIWYKDDTGGAGSSTRKSSDVRHLIKPLKDMTHEVVIQEAVQIDFAVSAHSPNMIVDEFREYIQRSAEEGAQDISGWFNDSLSFIEVTLDTSNIYTSPIIKADIGKIIFNYFANSTVGQFINYNDILNEIFKIPGVRNVRTVRYAVNANNEFTVPLEVYNGLSFMTCVHNLSIMDAKDSLEVGNSGFQLEPFQSAYLMVNSWTEIRDKIKLISQSGTMLNPAQY